MAPGGGIGAFTHLPPPPSWRLCPLHLPDPHPTLEETNGKHQPFSANFWIFSPTETLFVSKSMAPQKHFWCRHWRVVLKESILTEFYIVTLTLTWGISFNTSSEGGLLQPLPGFSIQNAWYPYIYYQCIGMDLLYPLIPKRVPFNFIWQHCDVMKSARPQKFGCIENIREN